MKLIRSPQFQRIRVPESRAVAEQLHGSASGDRAQGYWNSPAQAGLSVTFQPRSAGENRIAGRTLNDYIKGKRQQQPRAPSPLDQRSNCTGPC
ncbi:hypothetical protein HispidOSU_026208 [Sigmodon hispidus]